MKLWQMIEWFGLEGTFKIMYFQPQCYRQGRLPLDQVAHSPIQPGLECYWGGGEASSVHLSTVSQSAVKLGLRYDRREQKIIQVCSSEFTVEKCKLRNPESIIALCMGLHGE